VERQGVGQRLAECQRQGAGPERSRRPSYLKHPSGPFPLDYEHPARPGGEIPRDERPRFFEGIERFLTSLNPGERYITPGQYLIVRKDRAPFGRFPHDCSSLSMLPGCVLVSFGALREAAPAGDEIMPWNRLHRAQNTQECNTSQRSMESKQIRQSRTTRLQGGIDRTRSRTHLASGAGSLPGLGARGRRLRFVDDHRGDAGDSGGAGSGMRYDEPTRASGESSSVPPHRFSRCPELSAEGRGLGPGVVAQEAEDARQVAQIRLSPPALPIEEQGVVAADRLGHLPLGRPRSSRSRRRCSPKIRGSSG